MAGDGQRETDRPRHKPTRVGDQKLRLYGVGPDCAGCGGPTYAVTGDEDAELPWWCPDCNVRFDDVGEYGSAASFPAGVDPDE